MEHVETVSHDGTVLAYIVSARLVPAATTFITPDDLKQQVGFIVYPKGGEIPRHVHLPIERHLVGTSEVILVRSGRCELDIYNDAQELVVTRTLGAGDLMLMVAGGHGFRMLEDTVLLEVKQGPYTGLVEKKLF